MGGREGGRERRKEGRKNEKKRFLLSEKQLKVILWPLQIHHVCKHMCTYIYTYIHAYIFTHICKMSMIISATGINIGL